MLSKTNYNTVKPRFTVPRFTGNPYIPGSHSFLQFSSFTGDHCKTKPRFTGVISFPPTTPVNQGLTVVVFLSRVCILQIYAGIELRQSRNCNGQWLVLYFLQRFNTFSYKYGGGVQPHFCPCPFSLLGRGVIHKFLPVFGSYHKATAKLPKTGKNDFRVYFATTLYKLSNYMIFNKHIYLLPAHVILLPIK